MATILLSAAGAALGGGFGGTVLGLSGAVIGRAVGATLGRVIDQRLLGAGSEAVETGRVERFRLMGASEGDPVTTLFGRMRSSGQVIWATRFLEASSSSGGGKGTPKPKVTSYSYTVSFAVAFCEGEISGIGRVWADGVEIGHDRLNLRLYTGSEDQLPDPKIEAVEGAGNAPAYRGIAYAVIEDLELSQFGNRVPQLTFEVIRPVQGSYAAAHPPLQSAVRAVAMIPGTGEFALATTPLSVSEGPGLSRSVNVHTPSGKSDLETSLDQLRDELPSVGSISLVVSWFGDDLRCGECTLRPMVEQMATDTDRMDWRAGGITRAEAQVVASNAGRAVYGGTPADASVIEAIREIRARGQEVMFYPFILMDQLADNGRPDPYSAAPDQPVLPWRGRITTARAPGQQATSDRTAAAAAEVAAFFGTAAASDFAGDEAALTYSGPQEWRYRRFILHYAHLCAAAGGVDAFCIGSEMRGLTQIRGAGDSFPAVEALRMLAADVRAILGPLTKISYAADWTEYFGYQADGNLYFHLDPLWAHPAIDFVGIDNYMPLSDWRDGFDHADAGFGAVTNLDYLKSNILGGEGYDWYYDSPEGQAAQRRLPITDGAHDEPWVYRYKDIRNWWANQHHERINGQRIEVPTDWVPGSKPLRFTEYGCAAIDKGTNEPNKFVDPKSSESALPKYSSGRRDDFVQMQYLRAMHQFWTDPVNNPAADAYPGRMLDFDRCHVWAWDARPFPVFPNTLSLWLDGDNYPRGHWLNGRAASQPLPLVVADICEASGLTAFEVEELSGTVRGYTPEGVGSARAALQPLMLVHGFDAIERDGVLRFSMRGLRRAVAVDPARLAVGDDRDSLQTTRAPEAETAGRVRLGFVEAEADFAVRSIEAIFPDEESFGVSQSEVPMLLTAAEARGVAERWLSEARVARDAARFALPRSMAHLGAGDVLHLSGADYRIDRVEQAEASAVEAVRIETSVYVPSDAVEERVVPRAFTPPVPVFPLFLDLPLMTGQEVAHAPHVAATALPWPGSVGLWSAVNDAGYVLNTLLEEPATLGVTQSPLFSAQAGLWDTGPALRVKLSRGALSSSADLDVLNGANAMAIGDGSSDRWEIFQFADAALVATQTYDLTRRLRGQLGSDALQPSEWPVGSFVVLLDNAPRQIELALSARNLARHYRIGAAARGPDDPAALHRIEAFAGIGLRPYAPVHLRVSVAANGNQTFSWIRRTRIDGDSWESFEVPLGEDREQYLLRVRSDGAILREAVVSTATWTYTASQRAADAPAPGAVLEVAQISDRFGPGLARAVAIPL